MAKPRPVMMETITPTHNRYRFAENIVVDVKLEEIGPGRSAINHYLNGLFFNRIAHPVPDRSRYPREADLAIAMEGWVAGIYANPTGEDE